MTGDSLLALKGITKEYKEFRLGPLDLSVPRGYVMGLVGANGAGKTPPSRSLSVRCSPRTGRRT